MEEISFYDGLAWPGKHRTVNGREIFDTDQEIGWRAALYPISSAIKLGAFQNCLDKSEASRSSIILLEANLPLEATMCILTKTIAKL